jgi:hypothetical protein
MLVVRAAVEGADPGTDHADDASDDDGDHAGGGELREPVERAWEAEDEGRDGEDSGVERAPDYAEDDAAGVSHVVDFGLVELTF